MSKYSLKMENTIKKFGKGHNEAIVLKGINFQIKPGEFVSIIGPSGSGKSTFLTIAGGLQTPTEGSIIINDHDFSNLPEKQRAFLRLKDIGFILQSSNLIPFLSIKEQFMFMDKVQKRKFQERKFEELLKSLDVAHLKDSMPRDLSGGEKQRVAIGTALYNDPAVILADEPTASLDTEHAYEVVKLLAKEAHEKNKATIMVTHDPRMIEFSDSVYRMDDGELVKDKNFKKNLRGELNKELSNSDENKEDKTILIQNAYKLIESMKIDEINIALAEANSQEERDFYIKISKFIMKKEQEKIIKENQ